MSGYLRPSACSAGLAVVADQVAESGPVVVSEDEVLRLVLPPVSGCRMVVSGAEDAETEVTGVRYVGTVVVAEESIGVEGPARVSVGGMGESGGELRGGVVRPLSGADVGPELLLVEDDHGAEYRESEDGSPERRGELLVREHWSVVVWVDDGVVTVPLFWVDVPPASECVGLRSEFTGSEPDDHVELRQVLRPSGLSAGQELRCREVLQVLVVRYNVYRSSGPFEVVPPDLECLEDGEEFLVVRVVVQFRSGEGPGVERDRMEFAGVRSDGQDTGDGVVGGVRLNGNLAVRYPVVKDRSASKCRLEVVEGLPTRVGEVPRDIFSRQARQRKDDFGVGGNEPAVEVRESEERLDIADFSRLRPLEDSADLVVGHGKAVRGQDVSEVFHGVLVEFALVCSSVELMLAEPAEYLLDVFPMIVRVVGVDEDVV